VTRRAWRATPAIAIVALAAAAGTMVIAVGAQETCSASGAVSFHAAPLSPEQRARELLLVPGTIARPGVASPTRAPWLNTNGARFMRKADGKYRYELPEGKGALAAAEAVAYGADAVLQIAPADQAAVCRVFAFVKDVPPLQLPALADLGVVDDGSPVVAEVMNLLVRRNLLFRIVTAPQSSLPVNVRLGTPEYPVAEAADPSAFALKIRRQLTDERRRLRIFGSEVVVARMTGDDSRVRIQLLNYGNRDIAGLRVRVRGSYRDGEAYVLDRGRVALADEVVAGGATEFSIPLLTTHAVVDLR
jgi:hypothetical protein